MNGATVTDTQRAYAYRIALAISALLVGYGVLSEAEAAQWAVLAAALLGIGSETLATRHTTTKDPADA